MQVVSITGRLTSEVEKCQDKNGHFYHRFTVQSQTSDIFGRDLYTIFRCTCYVPGVEQLKKGDKVFMYGKFSVRAFINSQGKPEPICNIMIYQVDSANKYERE